MKAFIGTLLLTIFSIPCLADKDIWYFDFSYKVGLGASYSDNVSNDLTAIGATNHKKYGMEYAFRRKMAVPQLYLGGAVPILWDKFDRNNTNAPDNIVVSVPAASIVYTPTEDIADGPFFRFDLGYGVVNRPGRDVFGATYAKVTDSGLGYTLGAGWGLPFGEGFAIFPSLSYTAVKGTESYAITSFGFGIIL